MVFPAGLIHAAGFSYRPMHLFVLPALTFLLIAGTPALASEVKFSNPVDCELETDCWVIQYPDIDPGDDYRDYAGFTRSYPTHKGVDIGIASMEVMRQGVSVIAPADGTVLRLRDDMPDRLVNDQAARDAVGNQECGNGMVIDHGDGLETQLCHMRQGSIGVRVGDQVQRGDILGEVGASGLVQFPHLHVTTRLDGTVIDPATMLPLDAAPDAEPLGNLWGTPKLAAYNPLDIVQLGFSIAPLTIDQAIEGGMHRAELGTSPPALILWTVLYGVRAGDRLRLQIIDPQGGTFFDNEDVLENTKIRWFQFSGRRVREPLEPGIYTGRVTLTREQDGEIIRELKQTLVEITR